MSASGTSECSRDIYGTRSVSIIHWSVDCVEITCLYNNETVVVYEESSHVIAINMLMFTSLSPGIECNSSVMPYKLNHRLADHIE